MKITKKELVYEVNNRILSTNQCTGIKERFQYRAMSPDVMDSIVETAVKTYRKNLIERIRDPTFNKTRW